MVFGVNSAINCVVILQVKVNQVEDGDKSLTKDGIHLIIGIKASRAVQMHLRTKVMEKIGAMWKGLPIVNTWDQVFDSSISSGNTGWQLYGSRKPDHKPYKLTHIYENKFDPADNEPMTDYIPLKNFKIAQNLKLNDCALNATHVMNRRLHVSDNAIPTRSHFS